MNRPVNRSINRSVNQGNAGAGIIAGLVAGVVFGFLMQMMLITTPDGDTVSMMSMVAAVLGSTSLFVGWLYHLFNSAVIGAIFGGIFGSRIRRPATGLRWGAIYGAAWWVVGGLILMPTLLGMPAFSPLTEEAMQPGAWGSLLGHLIYGLTLGGIFGAMKRREYTGTVEEFPRKAA